MLPFSLVVLISCSVCRNFQWKKGDTRHVCHHIQHKKCGKVIFIIWKYISMAWHCCCKWPYIGSTVKWERARRKIEALFSKSRSILIVLYVTLRWLSFMGAKASGFVRIGTADLFGKKLIQFLLAFHRTRIRFTKNRINKNVYMRFF